MPPPPSHGLDFQHFIIMSSIWWCKTTGGFGGRLLRERERERAKDGVILLNSMDNWIMTTAFPKSHRKAVKYIQMEENVQRLPAFVGIIVLIKLLPKPHQLPIPLTSILSILCVPLLPPISVEVSMSFHHIYL